MDNQDKFDFPIPFQVNILSYMLKDNNVFRKLGKHVKPSYFTEFQLREIMEIAYRFFDEYDEVPDKTSMLNEINDLCLKNESKFVEDYKPTLDALYTFSFNEEYVSNSILRFIKIQSIYKGLVEAYNNRDNGDLVLKIIEDSVKVGNNINFDGGYNYKERLNSRIKCLEKGIRAEKQVKIQMLAIDHITEGGLGAGELGVVIGKTGGGKSIFLCNVAVGACMTGHKVVYFTMEASEEILASRIDCKISTYNKQEMKARIDKLKGAVARLPGELVIKEFPTDITTALDISNYINDMIVNGFRPDLVIVDYIGILAPTKRCKEMRHAIGNVCKGLVAHIGKKYRVPVWSAHQSSEVDDEVNVNKKANYSKKDDEYRIMGIGSISEGKVALASEVDLLITMNQSPTEKAQSPQGLTLGVPKNRIGPAGGKFKMTIDKTRFIIAETGKLDMPYG